MAKTTSSSRSFTSFQMFHTHTPSLTQLCHTPSLTHTQLCHTTSITHTHSFVIHTHTTLSHTPSFTHNFVTHHLVAGALGDIHLLFTTLLTQLFLNFESSTTSFVFPSFPVLLQLLFLLIVRKWRVGLSSPLMYILTSKCASCHNSLHFFHISTSKRGPCMWSFVQFDLDMCFAPQPRALFRHLN